MHHQDTENFYVTLVRYHEQTSTVYNKTSHPKTPKIIQKVRGFLHLLLATSGNQPKIAPRVLCSLTSSPTRPSRQLHAVHRRWARPRAVQPTAAGRKRSPAVDLSERLKHAETRWVGLEKEWRIAPTLTCIDILGGSSSSSSSSSSIFKNKEH